MIESEYRTILVDLPPTVRGLIVEDAAGFPTVIINARLSAVEQRRVLEHELDHYTRDDPHGPDTIRRAEGLPERTLQALDGSVLERPAVDPNGLRRIDEGLYLPCTPEAEAWADGQLSAVSGALRAALAWIRIEAPAISRDGLRWIGFSQDTGEPMLRVESPDVSGAVYPANGAQLTVRASGRVLSVDLRREDGLYWCRSITDVTDGRVRLYMDGRAAAWERCAI